jgi:hypothetical protein
VAKPTEDEPLFVLRAQDILAPRVIRDWARMAEIKGCPLQKVQEANKIADAMEAWPNRKYPD